MRLARNYNFSTHEDASKLRDLGSKPIDKQEPKSEGSELLAKVSVEALTNSLCASIEIDLCKFHEQPIYIMA